MSDHLAPPSTSVYSHSGKASSAFALSGLVFGPSTVFDGSESTHTDPSALGTIVPPLHFDEKSVKAFLRTYFKGFPESEVSALIDLVRKKFPRHATLEGATLLAEAQQMANTWNHSDSNRGSLC